MKGSTFHNAIMFVSNAYGEALQEDEAEKAQLRKQIEALQQGLAATVKQRDELQTKCNTLQKRVDDLTPKVAPEPDDD